MTATLLRLRARPRGPVGPLTASHVFGAICAAWRDLHGLDALLELLAQFERCGREAGEAGADDADDADAGDADAVDAPFRLSEVLPYADAPGGPVDLYPAPLLPEFDIDRYTHDPAAALLARRTARRLRGLSWISGGVLGRLTTGNLPPHRLYEALAFTGDGEPAREGALFVVDGRALMTEEEHARIPVAARRAGIVRSVTRTRTGPEHRRVPLRGVLYPAGGIHLVVRAGPGVLGRLEPVLRLAARLGVGRGRSIGWGRLGDLSAEAFDLAEVFRGEGAFLSLARVVPTAAEARAIDASSIGSYRVATVEGRSAEADPATGRTDKAPVRVLEAGAVTGVPVEGWCPVVAGESVPGARRVLHYGLGLSVPVDPVLAGVPAPEAVR